MKEVVVKLKSVKGLWADLGISISAKAIDEARHEMWGNFPREDIVVDAGTK
jgi:hypothetical protein